MVGTSKRHAHWLVAVLAGLSLTFLFLLAQSGYWAAAHQIYQRLELVAYDLRMQWHLPDQAQAADVSATAIPIVIVDVDEASLLQEGRWPWSRAKLAQLVQQLQEAGALVIGFDVLFAEPELNPVAEVLAELSQHLPDADFDTALMELAPAYDRDTRLAEVLNQTETVLGYVFHPQLAIQAGQLPPPLPVVMPHTIADLAMPPMTGYSAPLPVLMDTAATAGFFSLVPDADGVVRRAPMLALYQDQIYPSLSLEMLRRLLFLDQITLHTAPVGNSRQLESIQLDAHLTLPTDGQGQLLIPYRGPGFTYPYVPAWTLLDATADQSIFEGALVLVGTSAPGLLDLRATPLDRVYPGVEVHANLLRAMLDGQFLQQPSWTLGANLALTLVLGVLLSLLLPWCAPLYQLLVTLVALAVSGSLLSWFWSSQGLVLDLALPVALILLVAGFNFCWGFFHETLVRRKLAGIFGQYVPPTLVAQMTQNPEAVSFDGESRELTVLFSDIRGFTSLSENLPADQLKQLLNRYFTPVTRVIFDHQGTIDKYIGDLVMAFWGAPLADEKHALHAVTAALQMQQVTHELGKAFVQDGLPAIQIGIGINTGVMNVGDMGSEYRRAYTVLGDAVNLASRLESASKYYGVPIVVGEKTRQQTEEQFLWRELDLVQVKGKQQAVRVYQPVCPIEAATPAQQAESRLLQQALVAFRQQQWTAAQQAFQQLATDNPQPGLYSLYLKRIAILRETPPATDWDGSWQLSEK